MIKRTNKRIGKAQYRSSISGEIEENSIMSTKMLYIICFMIIFFALIIDDMILMLLALSVVVTSITHAWWRQETDRKNRFSG